MADNDQSGAVSLSEEASGRWIRAGFAGVIGVLALAMLPYTSDPTGDIKNLVLSGAAFVLTAAWLLSSWRRHEPVRWPRLFLGLLVAFLVLNLVAALRSDYVGLGMVEVRRYWALFLLYLVASQVYRTAEQVNRLLLVTCGAMLLASIYGFFQKIGLDFFPWADMASEEYLGAPATFGNPNYAAHALILAIIMAVYLAVNRNRFLGWVFAAVFLAHLYLTHQRSGLIALAGAGVLILVFKGVAWKLKRPALAAAVTLGVAVAVTVAGLGGFMGVMKARTGEAYPLDASLLLRYTSYGSAARMVIDRPILGYGPGAYQIENVPYWSSYEKDWLARERKQNFHVHNDALELAVDAGLFAAGIYFALLIVGMGYGLLLAGYARDRTVRRLGLMFAAFFAAFLADGSFGFNLRVPVSAAFLFVVAGMLDGLWLGPAPRPAPQRAGGLALAWRVAVLALALASVVFDARVFASTVCLQRGEANAYRLEYAAAETWLARGEALAPWNWEFPRQRGLMQAHQTDLAGAEAHLQRALTRHPYHVLTLTALAQNEMGLAAVQAGGSAAPDAAAMLEQAEAHARRALYLCPRFAQTEETLGRITLLKAIQMTKRPPGNNERPDALEGLWRETETHVQHAIEFGSDHKPELYRLLAKVRLALNNLDDAEKAFVLAGDADPEDEETWRYFFDFAKRFKRFDGLRGALEQQVDKLGRARNPNAVALSVAYQWLGTVQETGYGNHDAAEAAYRESVRQAPQRAGIWRAYGNFAKTADRRDALQADLIEASAQTTREGLLLPPPADAVVLALQPGPEALLQGAEALVAGVKRHVAEEASAALVADEFAWATEWLSGEVRNAAKAGSTSGAPLLSLGIVYAAMGDPAAADRFYAEAMPQLDAARQTLCAQHWSDALLSLNRAPDAVKLLRDSLSREPDNALTGLQLARSLARAGKPDEARAEYQRLLQLPALLPQEKHYVEQEIRLLDESQKPAQAPAKP